MKKPVKLLNITNREIHRDDRIIRDHEDLVEVTTFFKQEGKKIVYTSGVYDLFHVGHSLYLEKAKNCGDILVLAIDSDEFVKSRKGPKRPIVTLEERLEILISNRSVDIITVLHSKEQADALIKSIKPDILVISETTKDKPNFVEDMKQKLGDSVGEVKVLEPQAETSTSARVRTLPLDGANDLSELLMQTIQNYLTQKGGTE